MKRICIKILLTILQTTLFAMSYENSFEKNKLSEKELFALSCQTGDVQTLIKIIKKYKEGAISFTQAEISSALNSVITGGNDTVLLQLHFLWRIDSMDEQAQRQLVDLALRVGYSNTVHLLEQLGCRLTQEQAQSLNCLKEALLYPPSLLAPPPINAHHYETHGGADNAMLYQKEYRLLVAYTLYQLRTNSCDFVRLIEDLGHRRRHMAVLGQLTGIEFFGIPTNQYMYTFFSSTYGIYGQRIVEKYSDLPKKVLGKLNESTVALTHIHDTFWQHPKGDHREEILSKVATLCQKALEEQGKQLLYTFGSIIWWLSHAPPFLRGTPTIIYALLDAFCLYHQISLICKTPDLNCEALLYDNEEEFALYVVQRVGW